LLLGSWKPIPISGGTSRESTDNLVLKAGKEFDMDAFF